MRCAQNSSQQRRTSASKVATVVPSQEKTTEKNDLCQRPTCRSGKFQKKLANPGSIHFHAIIHLGFICSHFAFFPHLQATICQEHMHTARRISWRRRRLHVLAVNHNVSNGQQFQTEPQSIRKHLRTFRKTNSTSVCALQNSTYPC